MAVTPKRKAAGSTPVRDGSRIAGILFLQSAGYFHFTGNAAGILHRFLSGSDQEAVRV